MKKIFSLVLLTGMLTLMSFSQKVDYSLSYENCFDNAGAYGVAMGVIFNLSNEEVNDLAFDYFVECTARQGMSGIDDEPYQVTIVQL